MRTAYSLPYQALALIEEKAEIEDNRANFQSSYFAAVVPDTAAVIT